MKNLTKKSRWMIYFSLFLSGTLILSTIIYIIASQKTSGENAGSIMLIVVLIAVLAIIAIVISRLKLKKNTKNLSPEFFEIYEEISDKLSGSTMSSFERKETMNDILDLFMLADKDNRSVIEVVGDDTDEFINGIQDSFGYRSSFIFNLLTGFQYGVIYLFMIQLFIYFENIRSGFFSQQLDISTIFMMSLMAFLGVPFLLYYKRKDKLLMMLLAPIALLCLFIATMETIDKYFMHIKFLYSLAEGTVNAFPSIGVTILWGFVFIFTIVLKWMLRKISIKKL